jgi:murein DD-endopeptidase MepM/ murein hydrolase activator NlpD
VGLSALRQLHPRISPLLWLGRAYIERTLLISNLYNHRQTPIEAGWSVKKTQVEDFRGGTLTYDSHNGTDFAIPVGTAVVAPAPGRVIRVVNEYNRGGLKVFIDHGGGLITNCAHLARAEVTAGDELRRGAPIGRSGYSGLDGLITFPFGIPHVHFNVWLNGLPIDPFGRRDEPSLWRAHRPLPAPDQDLSVAPASDWDPAGVEVLVRSCKTPSARRELEAIEGLEPRAAAAVIGRNYYPTRFDQEVAVYRSVHPRRPLLDAPFRAEDFDAVEFLDEL